MRSVIRPARYKHLPSAVRFSALCASAEGEAFKSAAPSGRFKNTTSNSVSLYPLTALALAACGGGGGGGSSPTPPGPSEPAANAPVLSVAGEQTLTLTEEQPLPADTPTGYTFTATDADGNDTVTLTITDADGNADDRFTIADDGSLNIVAGSTFDFETENPITLTITATDDTGRTDPQAVTITITDVDDAPTAFTLEEAVTTLAYHDIGTSGRVRIATLRIEDVDTPDIRPLTLSGTDAALFEIGTEQIGSFSRNVLYLKGSSSAALATQQDLSLDVTITEDDTGVAVSHTVTIESLFVGTAAADTFIGGARVDTVSYASSTAAVMVDLSDGAAESGGWAEGDVLTGIQNLIGSAHADTLYGDANNNVIVGGAGADTIDGGDGVDTASYASSDAAVTIGLSGAAGSGGDATGDTLSNIENLIGSGLDDTLTGDANDNVIEGGEGNDVLDGGEGNDLAHFNYVQAIGDLTINLQDPTRWKQNADGTWVSGTGDGFIYQRNWVDLDDDGIGASNVDADDEYDYFTAIERFVISGSVGNDWLTGGAGSDNLWGFAGNDVLVGGAGADVLLGVEGNDVLVGGEGEDNLSGGEGNDVLDGGEGDDVLAGWEGDDVFVLGDADSGRDDVVDFSSGTASGASWRDGTTEGGNDRIRVDTATGSETTIEAVKAAAQIRWTQDSNFVARPNNTNDRNLNDTVIYATKGSADTSDDVAIMVLEDFSEELTMAHFEIV